ncbi:hypothetical protein [Aquihabitans sp. McL0605]|uniref:hypothetical protein n=1 Tax=Aquihabitans sp. McL0605 TaxID=3415671 RepID=UPI003CE6D780
MSSRLTITVADLQGPAGETVDVIRSWAATGLLTDSLWIDRAGDGRSGVLVATDGTTSEVEVLDELANRPELQALTLVSLYLLPNEATAAAAPDAGADYDLVHPIRSNAEIADIDLLNLVMVVPAVGVAFPEQLFDERWSTTLLVAPEDRMADDQIATGIKPVDVALHAAAALASATGIWDAAEESPLAGSTGDLRGGGRGAIRIVRTAARFVECGPIADRIVAEVLSLSGGWPVPDGASPPAVPSKEAERVIGPSVQQMVEQHEVGFVPLPAPPAKPPAELGLVAGIKLFFVSFARILRGLPAMAVEEARRSLAKAVVTIAQGATFGADSNVVLTLRGETAGGMASLVSAEDQYEVVRSHRFGGTEVPVAEPSFWRDLRLISCGIADGAEYPDGYSEPRLGRAREVVLDPNLIAPTPYGNLAVFPAHEFGPGRAIRGCDPRGARDLNNHLVGLIAQDELVSTAPSPSRARVEALNKWVASRSRSFMWRLGEAISDANAGAANELAAALVILSEGAPSLEDGKADLLLRQRLRRYVNAAMVAAVLISVGAWWGTQKLWWGGGQAVLGAVLGCLVLLVVLVLAFIRIARQLAQNEHRRKRAFEAWLHAEQRAHHAAKQVTRFCSLYWQFLDWSEIVGGLVHRPWGEPPIFSVVDRLGDAPSTRSTLFASAAPVPEKLVGAVSQGQKAVMTVGWLSTLLSQLLSLSTTRYSAISATPIEQVDPDHDVSGSGLILRRATDTGEEIRTSRGNVLRDVLTEHFADDLQEEQATQVVAAALHVSPDSVLGPVEVDGMAQGLSGAAVSDFLLGLRPTRRAAPFPASLMRSVDQPASPNQPIVLLPAEVDESEDGAHTSTRAHLGQSLLYASIRVDLSDPIRLDDLSTLAPSRTGGPGRDLDTPPPAHSPL